MENKTHFCIGCNFTHEMESFRWKKKGSKWFCGRSIDCYGCKTVHANDGFIKITTNPKTGKTIELCRKWARPKPLSLEQKMAGMSPEEVMSGVHLGADLDPSLKGKSSNNWSEEHAQQVKDLQEVLE